MTREKFIEEIEKRGFVQSEPIRTHTYKGGQYQRENVHGDKDFFYCDMNTVKSEFHNEKSIRNPLCGSYSAITEELITAVIGEVNHD